MAKSRKYRTADFRTRQEREDDALELRRKGYPFSAIADLMGLSGPTVKGYVNGAKIRELEGALEGQQRKVIPIEEKRA